MSVAFNSHISSGNTNSSSILSREILSSWVKGTEQRGFNYDFSCHNSLDQSGRTISQQLCVTAAWRHQDLTAAADPLLDILTTDLQQVSYMSITQVVAYFSNNVPTTPDGSAHAIVLTPRMLRPLAVRKDCWLAGWCLHIEHIVHKCNTLWSLRIFRYLSLWCVSNPWIILFYLVSSFLYIGTAWWSLDILALYKLEYNYY